LSRGCVFIGLLKVICALAEGGKRAAVVGNFLTDAPVSILELGKLVKSKSCKET